MSVEIYCIECKAPYLIADCSTCLQCGSDLIIKEVR